MQTAGAAPRAAACGGNVVARRRPPILGACHAIRPEPRAGWPRLPQPGAAMDDRIATALIAAAISLGVSVVGFVASWLTLRAREAEVMRQIRSSYMDKLYERRLELYPPAFEIAAWLSRPPRGWASYDRVWLLERRNRLFEWMAGAAGLVISSDTIAACYDLLDCMGSNYGEKDAYSRVQMEKLVQSARRLRSQLRRDIRFLHTSDWQLARHESEPERTAELAQAGHF